MDHLVVVVDELREAEAVLVEVDEAVHVAERHVADAVVDLDEVLARCRRPRPADAVVTRREGAVVVAAVDEGVDDLAVGVDRRPAQYCFYDPFVGMDVDPFGWSDLMI